MGNKHLKIGDEVHFTSHSSGGRLIGGGIGIITAILEKDYSVRCMDTREYFVTIPGMRQGCYELDTIYLIEEEN